MEIFSLFAIPFVLAALQSIIYSDIIRFINKKRKNQITINKTPKITEEKDYFIGFLLIALSLVLLWQAHTNLFVIPIIILTAHLIWIVSKDIHMHYKHDLQKSLISK